MIIPANPHAGHIAHKEEIDEAVGRVLNSGWYILGQEVKAFEDEFAAYIGVQHGIGVASGTDALQLALRTLDVGPGDEVITIPHTAVATASAIDLRGAKPIFVDIEPDNLYPRSWSTGRDHHRSYQSHHPRSHLRPPCRYGRHYGDRSAPWLYVLEDCSQSHGAVYKQRKTGPGETWRFSACIRQKTWGH